MNILLLHVGLHVIHFSLRKCILYWLSNGSLHLNCHKSLSSLESSDGLVDLCVQRSKKKKKTATSQKSTHKFKPGQFTVSETLRVCSRTGWDCYTDGSFLLLLLVFWLDVSPVIKNLIITWACCEIWMLFWITNSEFTLSTSRSDPIIETGTASIAWIALTSVEAFTSLWAVRPKLIHSTVW